MEASPAKFYFSVLEETQDTEQRDEKRSCTHLLFKRYPIKNTGNENALCSRCFNEIRILKYWKCLNCKDVYCYYCIDQVCGPSGY